MADRGRRDGAWEFREMDELDKTERATTSAPHARSAAAAATSNAVATRRFRLYLSVDLLAHLS